MYVYFLLFLFTISINVFAMDDAPAPKGDSSKSNAGELKDGKALVRILELKSKEEEEIGAKARATELFILLETLQKSEQQIEREIKESFCIRPHWQSATPEKVTMFRENK